MHFQRVQQPSQQTSTEPNQQIKIFKVSQIIKQQPPVQTMTNQQLANYCHNQWKEWIKAVLQLKNLKSQNEQQNKINQINKKELPVPVNSVQRNTNQNMYPYQQPINSQPMAQQPFYPPYMQPSYNEMFRQQQQNMAYLSAQNQNRPQFGFNVPSLDHGNNAFPFPSFNSDMAKMVYNPPGYPSSTNSNTLNSKDQVINQNNQGHNNTGQ